MIVVDSNIVAARNLTSSLTSEAKQVEEKDPIWIVPVLWRYEFQNILASAIKGKQIKPEQALNVWERVSNILIENEYEPSFSKVVDLVAQYEITAYDGQFIGVSPGDGNSMCDRRPRATGKISWYCNFYEGILKARIYLCCSRA